jgi:hypothetical protein
MRALLLLFLIAGGVSAQVRVRFDPARPEIGPFPTDWLTLPDDAQKSGLRVNLPLPDCELSPSDCSEISLINQLDGFNVQARITVAFDGGIDTSTLRAGVFIADLGPEPRLIAVNRLAWDPASFTLTAKPDQPLMQGRRYALLVTSAVRDLAGNPVAADDAFLACTGQEPGSGYCADLKSALDAVVPLLEGQAVAGASIFTTLSGTALLESARQLIDLSAPPVVWDANIRAAQIRSLAYHAQVRTGDDRFQDIPFPAPPTLLSAFGVSRIVFGRIGSPWLLNDSLVIPARPTLDPLPADLPVRDVAFHILLPSTPMPPGGYQVLLAGHGLGDSRMEGPTLAASAFLAEGFAVVALNAVGHGYGPETTLRVATNAGSLEIPAPGRADDVNGDGVIDNTEGCIILLPETPVSIRDCLRQTAVDWLAMVRAIRLGLDFNGDGVADLNPDAITYWGQSLGAFYGTLLTAVEPSVKTAVLNVGGSSAAETARLSVSLRPLVQAYIALRTPSLRNLENGFDEQYAGRDLPVQSFTLPGAALIQDLFERLEWIEAPGAPSTFAPHLRTAPLDGLSPKRVLFQIAIGDQVIPNPANSQLIRAAGAREFTSVYRHDIARKLRPELPANPHAFFAFLLDANGYPIANAALQQALAFTLAGTDAVPDVNPLVLPYFGEALFETPEVLPETTGFLADPPAPSGQLVALPRENPGLGVKLLRRPLQLHPH